MSLSLRRSHPLAAKGDAGPGSGQLLATFRWTARSSGACAAFIPMRGEQSSQQAISRVPQYLRHERLAKLRLCSSTVWITRLVITASLRP